MRKKAQVAIEYLFLVGIIVLIIVPLFFYGTTESDEIKEQRAEDALEAIKRASDEVYVLGPGNKIETIVSLPKGVATAQLEKNNLAIMLSSRGQYVTLGKDTYANLTGYLPTEPGTYHIIAERGDEGICIYPKGEKEIWCKCFNPKLADPQLVPIDANNQRIECSINGQWQECSSSTVSYGTVIDQVRVRCIDADYDVDKVNITIFANSRIILEKIPAIAQPQDPDLYVMDAHIQFNYSGTMTISARCRDDCYGFGTHEESINASLFSIPYGYLIPYFINPTTRQEINYTSYNNNFRFPIRRGSTTAILAGVKCIGGECMYINAFLDPQ